MVSVEFSAGVATVTLSRPPVNALDLATVEAFDAALDRIDAAEDCGAILIRAQGTKAFCAGADIRLIERCIEADDGVEEMIGFVRRLQALLFRIEENPRPSVVAIDGAATGGGLELALACDVRVAGEDVRLGLPESRIGLVPGAGGTQRLPALVGRGTASLLILTGELVTGKQARELGIVQRAVPRDEVHDVALELARELAARPRVAVAAAKAAIALAPSHVGYEREIEATRGLLDEPETAALVQQFLSSR